MDKETVSHAINIVERKSITLTGVKKSIVLIVMNFYLILIWAI